jgi:hypothetical protein
LPTTLVFLDFNSEQSISPTPSELINVSSDVPFISIVPTDLDAKLKIPTLF